MNLRVLGKASNNSLFTNPVIETEAKFLYAATMPSKTPDWHSLIKSARFVDCGLRTVAIEERDDHAS